MRLPEHLFCSPTSHFYEDPAGIIRSGTLTNIALTTPLLPAGWTSSTEGPWLHVVGPEPVPSQGWKIHVSAVPETVDRVLSILYRTCLETRTTFKHLHSMDILLDSLAKYGDRIQCGKFAAIYTRSETHLHHLLEQLEGSLATFDGPYVLTDVRWDRGPVFVRFGAFEKMEMTTSAGISVPALRDPDGQLRPDLREPHFVLPDFVEAPDFLRSQVRDRIDGRDTRGRPFPYTASHALHFSNSGGIYVASPTSAPAQRVVLKEARPLVGLDLSGKYASDRLADEAASLKRLAPVPGVVDLIDAFEHQGHYFLVERLLGGRTLMEWIAEHFPFSRSIDPQSYAHRAMAIARQLIRTVRCVHQHDVCLIDIQPKNIMVDDHDRLTLIDLETAVPAHQAYQPTVGTPGFFLTENDDPYAQDWHACAQTVLQIFWPLVPINSLSATVSSMQLSLADDELSLDGALDSLLANLPEWRPANTQALTAVGTLPGDTPQDHLVSRLSTGIAVLAREAGGTLVAPGDIERFRSGGDTCIQTGLSGVISCLEATSTIFGRAREALVERLSASRSDHAEGYLLGPAGAVAALVESGATEAGDLRSRSMSVEGARRGQADDISFRSGIAGRIIAETAVCLTGRQQSGKGPRLEDLDLLADILSSGTPIVSPHSTSASARGLVDGWTGAALAFVIGERLHPGHGYGACARAALQCDVDHLEKAPDGSLQMSDGGRLLPYLAEGSAGVAFAVALFPRQLRVQIADDTLDRIFRAADVRCTANGGLLLGRAGLVATLSQAERLLGRSQVRRDRTRHHARALGQYMFDVGPDGPSAIAGHGGLKLSLDYGTGNAGVVHTARLLIRPSKPWSLFPGLASLGALA